MYSDFTPKFVRQYVNLNNIISDSVEKYISDVKRSSSRRKKHAFSMDGSILEKLY
jgi:3-methyl-2-oxobutanoate hydroxymethyltransferase